MPAAITAGDYEQSGPVSDIGYVFAEAFQTHDAAMRAAKKYAMLASIHSDRHLATRHADEKEDPVRHDASCGTYSRATVVGVDGAIGAGAVANGRR
jgi:hypothetical protein